MGEPHVGLSPRKLPHGIVGGVHPRLSIASRCRVVSICRVVAFACSCTLPWGHSFVALRAYFHAMKNGNPVLSVGMLCAWLAFAAFGCSLLCLLLQF